MNANDASKTTATYGYKFGDDFSFDAEKENKYSVSALSNIVNLGFDKGVMDMSAATLTLYKPLAETANVNDTQKLATLSATGAKIVKMDDTVMYFVLSNALYKINYTDKDAIVDKVSEEAINTSWLTISVIGDYLYYIENTYSYMNRLNLSDFVKEPNNLKYAEGETVSGTRKATLSKDDEDKVVIKYVDDDANEADVEYFQIPKFMTEADAQTYAEALYAEWEAENKKK